MKSSSRVLLVAALALAGCANFNADLKWRGVDAVVARHGPPAQDALYACLLSEYAQGISVQDAADDCASKLLQNGDKGYAGDSGGGGGGGGLSGGGGSAYDPGAIVAACSAGNPKLSSGPLGEYRPSSVYNAPDATMNGMELWGKGTYGGAGSYDDDGHPYKGLTEKESKFEKLLAIMNANLAYDQWQAKQEKANQETDPAKKKQLQDEADKLHAEYDEAFKDAFKDPNVCDKPPCKGVPANASSPAAGEDSVCSQMLQAARELLAECNRSAWSTYACQQLKARMSGCPDPALIYVDPDSGYSCGSRIDAEAVKNAWIKRCQQLAKYGPDGGDPCIAPAVDGLGRFISGNSAGICRSPFAYLDPDSGACAATMKIDNFGKPDSKAILLWALDKLGGPIFVIPSSPPPCPRC